MIDGPRFGNDFAFVWNEQFVYILQNIRREFDYHYLSLTSNTNKFIRFVLPVQKKKKKGERNK